MAEFLHGMNPEERDRLTRLETKLDYVIANLDDLPQSKLCQKEILDLTKVVNKINDRQEEHHDFIEGLKLKIGIVGAGFVLAGTALTYLIKYILSNLSFGWGS